MLGICSFLGCDKVVRARGWCSTHWARWYRRGDPSIVLPHPTGHIKFKSLQECLESGFVKGEPDDCWEWEKRLSVTGGYGCLWWDSTRIAHRASWMVYVGEIPHGLNVCHKCDNRKCVNPNHLFLGTSFDNNHDRKLKGRNANTLGEKNPFAKLKESEVRKIKEMLYLGIKGARIAKTFNVTKHAIYKIRDGKNWKHIT